jgi:hypothetical protein
VHVAWGYKPPITNFIQFVLDPTPSPAPGTALTAVTQSKVDGFYSSDNVVDYWDTQDPPDNECAPYVCYTLAYGDSGISVQAVQNGKNGKPAVWIVKTTNNPNDQAHLFVVTNDFSGTHVQVADYTAPSFEFAVSLNPITVYPTYSLAPSRDNNASITWGEIKAR